MPDAVAVVTIVRGRHDHLGEQVVDVAEVLGGRRYFAEPSPVVGDDIPSRGGEPGAHLAPGAPVADACVQQGDGRAGAGPAIADERRALDCELDPLVRHGASLPPTRLRGLE